MKKIYVMLFAILAFNAFLTSCSDEEPFSTATLNDEPRILDLPFRIGLMEIWPHLPISVVTANCR